MHVYFVNYHHFEGSSGIHIHFLANALERLGVRCTACVPRVAGHVFNCGSPRYDVIGFSALKRKFLFGGGALRKEGAILHAWTPREVVRSCVDAVGKRAGIPYFVHLEDNEQLVFETHMGVSPEDVGQLSWLRRMRMPRAFIHPARYRKFIANAAGVTCIMDSLETGVPESVPAMTFWPSCEPEIFDLPVTPDLGVRRSLGIPESSIVLTYTGNVHAANLGEVKTLYAGIAELNSRGRDVRLLRCGATHAGMDEDVKQASAPFVVELGSLPPQELVRYLAGADILVQPGKPDRFNDFRFPSKVPMFLASGRPVLLPATNIGRHLEHGKECLLLRNGTVEELVQSVERLIAAPALRKEIGAAGRMFARTHLSWEKSAKNVLSFYERCLHE
ncbi:glycosyltransferase [uncultured Pseudodesulfovibrio sp.]|uniref:glycosyltransferase family protein n=1 Tax=uncultured Pseudodesulfovibrio sp. TaxID=2035858 RepID=UPI0029C794B9|nr:glycosyltransferase [uncultured Pseudodesulfovibrio sp.]